MSSHHMNSNMLSDYNNSLGVMAHSDASGQNIVRAEVAEQHNTRQNYGEGQTNAAFEMTSSQDSYTTAPVGSQYDNLRDDDNVFAQNNPSFQQPQAFLPQPINYNQGYGYVNHGDDNQNINSQMLMPLPMMQSEMGQGPNQDQLFDPFPDADPPLSDADVAYMNSLLGLPPTGDFNQLNDPNLNIDPNTFIQTYDPDYYASMAIEEDEDVDSQYEGESEDGDDEMEDVASDQEEDSVHMSDDDDDSDVSGESDDEEEIARAAASGLEDLEDGNQAPQTLKRKAAAAFDSNALQATGINPDEDAIIASLRGEDVDAADDLPPKFGTSNNTANSPPHHESKRRRLFSLPALGEDQDYSAQELVQVPQVAQEPFDFFAALANIPELTMELSKHLHIKDFLSLYAISKDFHEVINGHLTHIMKLCATYNAPESSKIFLFRLYGSLCIPDPAGRLGAFSEVRLVPSLRWLTMIYHREKTVRDILACLAREGHRTPKSMALSLKKMWLTMDIATNSRRVQLMHNTEFWTDQDLYNIQLFFVKLDMRFNDPIDGPGDDGLRRLMIGQRGLTPLKKLLRREDYLHTIDIVRVAIRYAYHLPPEHKGLSVFGIPFEEIGKGHLEGWGQGRCHLYRPDELVMREATRRNLGLDDHLMNMLLWGYVDPITKRNIQVTEEEMYMSDDGDAEIEKKIKEVSSMFLEELTALKKSQPSSQVAVSADGVKNAQHVGDEWETEDEDMPLESMQDDDQDRAAIGPSGWRRNRKEENGQQQQQ